MFNNYNYNLASHDYNMAAAPSNQMTSSNHRFDEHFNKMVEEYLQTSACFLLQFEDYTEMLVCLPQTALVRDLYDEVNRRLIDTTTPIGIYSNSSRKTYITICNESLQNMVGHFSMSPVSPHGYNFPVFRLFLSLAPQKAASKSNKFKQKSCSAGGGNLAINGKAIGSTFGFNTTGTSMYG